MTDKIDPNTLSKTELILREKYAKDTLVTSSPEPTTVTVTKEAVDEEASEEDVAAFKRALELLELKARAAEIIKMAKQAKANKGKQ
ncbi:hypothetical protein ACIOYV_09855 [Pseudomonas sp. NPDC087342]|uniref:hypothetical protein n=1 Tax=Pseudomonas sp. NPDC087342 TaxID=3364437 RepID=UPI003807B029